MVQAAAPAASAADAKPIAAPPKAKGNKLGFLLVLLVLVNLGGTGFVAWRVLEPIKAEVAAEAPAAPQAPPILAGPTLALDAFVVNLNESNSARYLKTVLELELADATVVEAVNGAKPVLRDEFLRYLSGLSVADTLGEANKQKIQADLKQRAEKLIGQGRVMRLFFVEFVVQ